MYSHVSNMHESGKAVMCSPVSMTQARVLCIVL